MATNSPLYLAIQSSADGQTWDDLAQATTAGSHAIFTFSTVLEQMRNDLEKHMNPPDAHVADWQAHLRTQRESILADTRRSLRACFPERSEEMIAAIEEMARKADRSAEQVKVAR